MSCQFYAEADPSQILLSQVAALASANPFYTPAHSEYRRRLGFQPWIFSLHENDHLRLACTGFMKSGYLNRSLEIPSLPTLPDSDSFWEGLLRFCHKAKVSYLEVNSFASPSTRIPFLSGEIRRTIRWEYILNLERPGVWDSLSSNHVRNIKRAQKAGMHLRHTFDQEACREHARLVEVSMRRHSSQSESASKRIQADSFLAMVQSGAGEVFQAVLSGEVLSSVLVLLACKGAYYQSAGTTPLGMVSGSSHFLVHEIANILHTRSIRQFNLGGAGHNTPGLDRFKSGFGGMKVELESAEFYLGSTTKKKLGTAFRALRKALYTSSSSIREYCS